MMIIQIWDVDIYPYLFNIIFLMLFDKLVSFLSVNVLLEILCLHDNW